MRSAFGVSAAMGAALALAAIAFTGCTQWPQGGPSASPYAALMRSRATQETQPQLSRAELAAIAEIAPAAGPQAPSGDPAHAARFVQRLGDQAIAVMKDPALEPEERQTELRGLLLEGFDIETISRLVLGRYWRQATPQELEEYRRLFEEFVVSAYAARFERYSGETLNVVEARPDRKSVIVVKSLLRRPGRSPLQLDWLVRAADGRYRVIDVVVEGVSMAITQRSEFGAIIQNHGGRMQALLAALRDRTT